jgi:hypothetical protein
MEENPVTLRPRTSPALTSTQPAWQMAPRGLPSSATRRTRESTSGLRRR